VNKTAVPLTAVPPTRRTVASRILYSYLVVLLLFCGASTWSVVAFREAVSEAALLREGYLPLALSVRDLVSNQDTWNSQLNHVTSAKNPADARAWFETALRVGRPKKLAEVEEALKRALSGENTGLARRELAAELSKVRAIMEPDTAEIAQLFSVLERDESGLAQARRDSLVRHGLRVRRRLHRLEEDVSSHVDRLVELARRRETTAFQILIGLGVLTVLVGTLMALFARRVLRPLTQVTKRADAVAAGDLQVREPIHSDDEIGELSETFEAMVRAISETREKLLATERLATIGKMAAHVTHEVRNPLSSIALNLDLLEEELGDANEESTSLVRAIGQEVQRLSGLSDQYLNMARRKAPELEDCDVGALVRASTEFIRRDVERHGVSLGVELPENLPWVTVDQGQIRQTLLNLVRNAREAMPEGGAITLEASSNESQLIISVKDTGPGVPPEQVERLFDPFFTTKDHGTGLGLAVTAQILKAHGGSLEYERGEPRGSIFRVLLPLASGLDSDGASVG